MATCKIETVFLVCFIHDHHAAQLCHCFPEIMMIDIRVSKSADVSTTDFGRIRDKNTTYRYQVLVPGISVPGTLISTYIPVVAYQYRCPWQDALNYWVVCQL